MDDIHEVMNQFETNEQRLFRERVQVLVSDLKYVERGEAYIRFRDPETGKLYEVKIKEKK